MIWNRTRARVGNRLKVFEVHAMVDQREFRLLRGCNLVQVFQIRLAASDHSPCLTDPIRQNLFRHLVEVTGMGSKAKWNASNAMHQIGNQSWVMCKMGMQMIYAFSSSLCSQSKYVDQMYGLKKALPAAAGGIALIDPFICRDINQGADVSLEMQSGYFNILFEQIP